MFGCAISESASTRGHLSALAEVAAAGTGGGQALADESAGATPGCLHTRRHRGSTGGDAGSALIRVSSGTICRHPCHPLALDDGNESELTRVVPSGAGVHGEVTARATTNSVVKSVAAK